MKNRVDLYALKTFVALTATALALSSPLLLAHTPKNETRLASAGIESPPIAKAKLNASATSKADKSTSPVHRPRAKSRTPLHTASPLKLETKEAARRVVRNDRVLRERLTSVDAGHRISPNLVKNLNEQQAPLRVEMGDRPARSLSLCGDSENRRFAEIDSRTVASLLPEIAALRARAVCVRRRVLIADYAFK